MAVPDGAGTALRKDLEHTVEDAFAVLNDYHGSLLDGVVLRIENIVSGQAVHICLLHLIADGIPFCRIALVDRIGDDHGSVISEEAEAQCSVSELVIVRLGESIDLRVSRLGREVIGINESLKDRSICAFIGKKSRETVSAQERNVKSQISGLSRSVIAFRIVIREEYSFRLSVGDVGQLRFVVGISRSIALGSRYLQTDLGALISECLEQAFGVCIVVRIEDSDLAHPEYFLRIIREFNALERILEAGPEE